ncbi:MAG: hypothetical protein HY329_04925 [Chloroflexi bacterium]|nr:hypothetical protein [Chloroflexota bacterium]
MHSRSWDRLIIPPWWGTPGTDGQPERRAEGAAPAARTAYERGVFQQQFPPYSPDFDNLSARIVRGYLEPDFGREFGNSGGLISPYSGVVRPENQDIEPPR